MKNFTLEEAPVSRKESFLLLHLNSDLSDADREFEPFSRYARWLSTVKGYAYNTNKSYCEHAARFIDYVYEAGRTDYRYDPDFSLETVVYSYQSFLLFGKDSSDPLANELAHRLNKNTTTRQTSIAQNIESAVRSFLEVSAARPDSNNQDPLFGRLLVDQPQYKSHFEISAQKANSWLAGTVRGSLSSVLPKRKGQKLFPRAERRANKSGDKRYKTKAFPIELSGNLIKATRPKRARTYWRDMAFYSLLAATGARTHEALQIRLCDIVEDEAGNDTVELHSPFSRKNPGITQEEDKLLSWKGRETPITFMIEPFATEFWHALNQYIRLEYNSSVNHDFIFQTETGRPFFATDRSSRDKTFKKYARLAGVEDLIGISPHSLRHMYGTYLLNYLPMPGNQLPGFPIAYVQILMGHASASSTNKYAKHDTDVISSYIQYANQQISQLGSESLQGIKKAFFQKQLEAIEKEIMLIEGKNHD